MSTLAAADQGLGVVSRLVERQSGKRTLREHAEQQVLGADVDMAERPGLLLRTRDGRSRGGAQMSARSRPAAAPPAQSPARPAARELLIEQLDGLGADRAALGVGLHTEPLVQLVGNVADMKRCHGASTMLADR